jgi:MGT family glycosyltransferase
LRTALFFSLPYAGHIHPCLSVLEELVRRGDRVIAYTTEAFRPMLIDVGVEFRCFPHTQADKRALVTMAYWQLRVAASQMGLLAEDATADGADYILADAACYWGYALAKYLSLPLIALHSTFPVAFEHITHLQSIMLDLRKVPTVLPTVCRFLLLDRRCSRAWGIPRLISPIGLVKPRPALRQIVMAHESMQPRPSRGEYQFVGSCVRRRGMTRGDPLPEPDGRPLIYISLGTIWNDCLAFYQLCIEAFRGSPYRVLMSIGSTMHALDPQSIPENICIREYVDQIAVLEQATVFISHGGMNSICEALDAALPMILLPQANDQFALSELMSSRGVAVLIDQERLSAPLLRATTDYVARDPDIRTRCLEMQTAQRSRGVGGARAAESIHTALKVEDFQMHTGLEAPIRCAS